MKKKLTHTRAISATILADLLEEQQPFVPYAAKAYAFAKTQEDKAFITDLCFQTLRAYPKLVLLSQQFLDKPFRQQDTDVFCLLLIGLGELDREQKSHAAIFEAVEGCVYLNKPWAKKVMNACLRSYQREKTNLAVRLKDNLVYHTEHPSWLIAKIKAAWPNDWEKILLANNEHPPMTLWINPKKTSLEAYQLLITAEAIDPTLCPYGLNLLNPLPQQELPDYALGAVNVQNASAQLAAEFLRLNDRGTPLRILDACAAPGNKTANILAKLTHPKSHVLALDVHKKRLNTAQNLFTRLSLDTPQVAFEVANAGNPTAWWDQVPFDRILLDAPCSGTGVIRRHPDIKCHLTPERIAETKAQQAKLLNALWPLLKPGGLFLYSTCSVLPEENEAQIAQLLSLHADIEVIDINLNASTLNSDPFSPKLNYGTQIFPQGIWDGFYYCLMSKKTR